MAPDTRMLTPDEMRGFRGAVLAWIGEAGDRAEHLRALAAITRGAGKRSTERRAWRARRELESRRWAANKMITGQRVLTECGKLAVVWYVASA